jgi:hypothetical protein
MLVFVPERAANAADEKMTIAVFTKTQPNPAYEYGRSQNNSRAF